MMNSKTLVSKRTGMVLLALFLWIPFLCWIGYLLRFQSRYAHDYLSRMERLAVLPVYVPGDVVSYTGQGKVMFVGWSQPEAGFRWSDGRSSAFLLRLPVEAGRGQYRLRLTLAATAGLQRVRVLVNHRVVETVSHSGPGILEVAVPAGRFKPGAVNSIELDLPDAFRPTNGDSRYLALQLVSFQLSAGSL
jgi:hypothetical protein